jgi:hypothetical protein
MLVGIASQFRALHALFLVLALGTLGRSLAMAQCAEEWLDGPDQGNQGVAGTVNAALQWTMPGPDGPRQMLVVAGLFTQAGLASAQNLALCDSQNQWSSFGLGANAEIRALCSYNGQLIAAGDFIQIDGVAANRIARWDGANWNPLGPGLNGSVRTLRVIDGKLYVGGAFTTAGVAAAMRVASWDGSEWAALGAGLSGGTEVRALEQFQGRLYAVGNFTTSDALATPYLASWDGTSWRAEPGSNESVYALASWNGMLYAGGQSSSKPLRVWNGTTWSDVGTGLSGSAKYVRAFFEFDGRLAIGGSFLQAGSVVANSVALWDGAQWSALGTGVGGGTVLSLAIFNGNLVAAGSFKAHEVRAISIAQWNGAAWTSLGSGLYTTDATPSVTAFFKWKDDLVMCGNFNAIGSVRAENIAFRRNNSWSAPAVPLGNYNAHPTILAMLEWEGNLVVAGRLSSAGGTPAANIASWNGTAWSAFGAGFGGNIRALAIYNNELIVASDGSTGGPWSPNYLARWDGTQFQKIANGPGGAVYALAVHRGELIAGGRFVYVNTNTFVGGLARWNGSQWRTVGDQPDRHSAFVNALAIYEGDLVVGGRFSVPTIPTSNIARWNGEAWSAFETPNPLGEVAGLAVHNGKIYAAHSNTNSPTARLSRWTGSAWADVGTPITGNVSTLYSFDEELLLGGTLTSTNGSVSVGWARFGGCADCPADLNTDTQVGDDDFQIFLVAYNTLDCADPAMPANCASDFNADGFVDDSDFITFVAAYDALLCP